MEVCSELIGKEMNFSGTGMCSTRTRVKFTLQDPIPNRFSGCGYESTADLSYLSRPSKAEEALPLSEFIVVIQPKVGNLRFSHEIA